MGFHANTVAVTSTSTRYWKLLSPVVYDGRDERFVVPLEFCTDFATIPGPVRWLVERTGAHTLPAVLHDWLVTEGIECRGVTHRDADGLFRRALRESGVRPVRRWIMWAGVRYGSLVNGRRNEWWRDAPAVLGITVLAFPFVLPPSALAVVGFAVYFLLEAAAVAAQKARRWMRRQPVPKPKG